MVDSNFSKSSSLSCETDGSDVWKEAKRGWVALRTHGLRATAHLLDVVKPLLEDLVLPSEVAQLRLQHVQPARRSGRDSEATHRIRGARARCRCLRCPATLPSPPPHTHTPQLRPLLPRPNPRAHRDFAFCKDILSFW